LPTRHLGAPVVSHLIVTPAIVLRRVAYGEADLVVTLLGLETGRVSALARAARKSSRRFAGGVQPGLSGEARLRERPGADLFGLEEFDASSGRPGLASDVAKAAHAAYAIELCDRLCPPRQPERAVYTWLDELLSRLEAGHPTAERLRVFELGLLRALGLGPSLDRCAQCGREPVGDATGWLPRAGGVLCRDCGVGTERMSTGTRQALAALNAASLAEADAIALDRSTANACRRAVLALLREHVHGPLRSLDFIEKMSGARS
jgi:DNA repair protein RecO (recombination protein O)